MQNCTPSSSFPSKAFQFQDFDFSFNTNENSHIASTQRTLSKGKEPMEPRTLNQSCTRTINDNVHDWTFKGSPSVESSESSDSSSNEGPSRKKAPTGGFIKANNQQVPSMERFIILLEKINPGVPLSAVTQLNLSKQDIKSFDNTNVHLVSLKKLILSDNQLAHVTDMPVGLTCLNLARNRITNIDLSQLKSLHKLDLSHNSVEDFSSLIELRCLRRLDVSFNGLKSMVTFKNMNNLLWLSLKGNALEPIEFSAHNSYCLKYLDMSYNNIKHIEGLEHLSHLDELFLDHNAIICAALERPMKNLSKLVLDHNRLTMFDATLFPQLRHLSLDANSIKSIVGLKELNRLDTFSLRNQNCEKININIQQLRQSKKLFLAKCQFGHLNTSFTDFYSLKYLELCSLGIEKLPHKMAQSMPNLSTLNVNYNHLRDLHPIRGLKHLEELSLVGNMVPYLPNLIDTLSHLRQLKHLDLRKNPVTAVYYSSKFDEIDIFDTKSPSQLIQDVEWGKHDTHYLDTLDVSWKERRTIYRALIFKNCPSMVVLDRIPVISGESGQSRLIISDYISLFDPK